MLYFLFAVLCPPLRPRQSAVRYQSDPIVWRPVEPCDQCLGDVDVNVLISIRKSERLTRRNCSSQSGRHVVRDRALGLGTVDEVHIKAARSGHRIDIKF
jgi:hypothetical protein